MGTHYEWTIQLSVFVLDFLKFAVLLGFETKDYRYKTHYGELKQSQSQKA